MNCESLSETVDKVGRVKSGINDRECVGEKTPLDEAADSGKRYGDCLRGSSVFLARQEESVEMDEGFPDRSEGWEPERRAELSEIDGFARPQVVAWATKDRPGDGAVAMSSQEERQRG